MSRNGLLWDRHPPMPFQATAPWPVIWTNGYRDWGASVNLVEDWLCLRVGPHWQRWCWSMWSLNNHNLCSVRFTREPDTTLFLLQFG